MTHLISYTFFPPLCTFTRMSSLFLGNFRKNIKKLRKLNTKERWQNWRANVKKEISPETSSRRIFKTVFSLQAVLKYTYTKIKPSFPEQTAIETCLLQKKSILYILSSSPENQIFILWTRLFQSFCRCQKLKLQMSV